MILLPRILLFGAWISITVLAFLPDYSHLPDAASFSDLLNHSAAFCLLYLLYRFSYPHTTRQIIGLLFFYALFIEAVQAFLPTRCASIEDVVADTVGMAIGYGVGRWARLFPKRGTTG